MLPRAFRRAALKKLQRARRTNEDRLATALRQDLGKSRVEAYMCEIGLLQSELSYMIRHLDRFARPRTVPTPLTHFPAKSYVKPCPYGTVLVMSPWNYPVLLSLDPLMEALAAGNTVVLKPSAYSPATSALLHDLIAGIFPPEYVAVVMGGREENACLLEEKFDYIFFTGSKSVGREVMTKAARHLTPVTLELGGKSPCIVDRTADPALAARRIVFGKFLNCGQTCVAPDYILCDRAVKDELVRCLKREILRQFGAKALKSEDYGRIVNEKHFRRICALIDDGKVVYGGKRDEKTLKIEPTVLDGVTFSDAVMQEEIFGPVLPILTYEGLDTAIEIVNGMEKPLALYLFTRSRRSIARVTSEVAYGGGCINDVILHLATPYMGFGGVGESGMGSYHGKRGFDTFSHLKSILHKYPRPDLSMRYQPYTAFKEKLIRFFLK
jgi:aldehyde dehydrogenase (NAD+)